MIEAGLEALQAFVFGMLLTIDAMVYSLISWVYQIILVLCNANILGNGFEMQNLVRRIYTIIGVVVLFLVAYSLLKSLVNPDEALKGKKSPVTIIRDVIISVVLIAVIPSIFDFAMGFQSALLTKNTIGSLILGNTVSVGTKEEDSQSVILNGGTTIATGVLEAFLHPDYSKPTCKRVGLSEDYPNGYNCDDIKVSLSDREVTFQEYWKLMQDNNNLYAITNLNKLVVGSGPLTYYWLISTIAGAFVLFVLLSYCFDIAVRSVKLAVFELIAPLPILARLLPNEQGSKTFNNWVKATISTYTEVFIRLAILFFAVLVIKIIVQNFPSMLAPLFSGEAGWTVALFAQMFLIIGVILFVKQAPEIIKEITGLDGGKYNVLGSAMRGLSTVGAIATGATKAFNTAKDKDAEGWRKGLNMANRFKSGVLGGLKSAYNVAGKEYKKPSDLKTNTHDAVEDVINKQRKRQAAAQARKQDYKSYAENLKQGDHEPDIIYRARKAAPTVAKFLHDRKEEITDWAGAGDFDTAKLARTKEMADQIKSQFDTMEGAWNKKKAYSDTQSKLKEAEGLLSQIKAAKAKGMSDADILKNYGTSLDQAQTNATAAKAAFNGYVRTERGQKADIIVQAAREMQLVAAQYSDVKLDQERIIKRTGGPADHQAMRDAIAKYGDLSVKDNLKLFEHDLREGDEQEYKDAKAFIDYFDNMKKEAQEVKGDAVYQEHAKGAAAKKKEEK